MKRLEYKKLYTSSRLNARRNGPGALEFDPEKIVPSWFFSGYVQNINRNKISKVPKFPPCAKFFTAIFQNGRLFGRKWLFYFISNQTTQYTLPQSWFILHTNIKIQHFSSVSNFTCIPLHDKVTHERPSGLYSYDSHEEIDLYPVKNK